MKGATSVLLGVKGLKLFISCRNGSALFASACQRIQEGVNKYLETHDIARLSDDEEEEEEIPEELIGERGQIVQLWKETAFSNV